MVRLQENGCEMTFKPENLLLEPQDDQTDFVRIRFSVGDSFASGEVVNVTPAQLIADAENFQAKALSYKCDPPIAPHTYVHARVQDNFLRVRVYFHVLCKYRYMCTCLHVSTIHSVLRPLICLIQCGEKDSQAPLRGHTPEIH